MDVVNLWTYIVEQLPVAALLLVGGYLVARYAAGVMDKLLGSQTETQKQLVDVIDRNTKAWAECAVSIARVSENMASLAAIQQNNADHMANQSREIAQDIRRLRVTLATRPCITENAASLVDGTGEGK